MELMLRPDTALVVVDAQQAFDDPSWGPRDNPAADANIEALVDAFVASGRPVVLVRHTSVSTASRFHPDRPGHAFKQYLRADDADLVVTKTAHSSFHGVPDLHAWLSAASLGALVVAGITTNHCCETTARVGSDLGYDVLFALDATHTFDRTGPDGETWTAAQLARSTATNLHEEFVTVVSTAQVVRGLALAAGACD